MKAKSKNVVTKSKAKPKIKSKKALSLDSNQLHDKEQEGRVLYMTEAAGVVLSEVEKSLNCINDEELRHNLEILISETLMDFIDFNYINSLEEVNND